MFRWVFTIGLILLAAFHTGCEQPDRLVIEYGKISGENGSTSVNGVSVFADMFAERGFRVQRRQRISPRIEQYETIVWFPDDYGCPSEETIAALNTWLDNGWERTLIYVGRDYNAQSDYLHQALKSAPINQKEEILRRIAEAKTNRDTGPGSYEYFWQDEDTSSCEWFNHKSLPTQKLNRLGGAMAAGIRTSGAPLEISTQLVPNPDTSDVDGQWVADPWLTANDHLFAFELMSSYDEYSENSIIVVSNGSFLLNYPLIDAQNRQLAGKLIDRCSTYGDVLFLESGPRGIDVSDSDFNNHNAWAWITYPPLRYIVPHFLMWGVLFCFVYFPIFGRPRRLNKQSTTSFRSHVDAIGKLLGRSDMRNRAINRIHKYQQITHGDSHRPSQEP